MKIALVNKFFFIKGGQESVMFDEAEFLQQNAHQIEFFSMHHPQNKENYEYSKYFVDHVEFSNLGKEYSFIDKLKIAKNFIYNHKSALLFDRFLTDFKPDIIHCHGIAHQLSPSILIVAKHHNIPVVQTLHDYQLVCPNYTFMLSSKEVCINHKCIKGHYYNCLLDKCIKNSYFASCLGMLESYFNQLTKMYIKNIDKFIVPSHFLEQMILDAGINKEKISYIPNFVAPYSGKIELSNNKYFLYIGRLSYEKGLKTLLQVFKDLPEARLKIIGSGPIKEELLRFKEKNQMHNVEFIGFVSRDDIDKYIRSCEALILPSEWYENAPISILEAFSMQKPVVGSNIGGIPEMIKHNYNGYLFQPGNSSDLKEQILKFNNNDTLSQQLGKNAQKYYDEEFNKEKHMKLLLSLYESVLS